MNAINATQVLAEELIALDRLSAEDVEQLRRLILDHIAVALCGSVQPWGRKLNQWAVRRGGPGKAVLIGSGRRAGAAAAARLMGLDAGQPAATTTV